MSNRSAFNWHVIDELTSLIRKRGVSQAELITKSGMRRNTFYAKMRGESALTTDDIDLLCRALDADPELVLHHAWDRGVSERMPKNVEVLVQSMKVDPTAAEQRAAEKLGLSVADLRTLTYDRWAARFDERITEEVGRNASPQARGHVSRRLVAELSEVLTRRNVGGVTEDDYAVSPEGPRKDEHALAARKAQRGRIKKATQAFPDDDTQN